MSNIVPAAQPQNIRAQIELSKQLAASNMLPRQYQGKPENMLWAIQYAESLGVHPMTAVTGIHVIEGKPTASAQLIGGLVRRAGHRLRVTFDRKTMTATAQIIRADDPDYTFESVWTMDRAKAANLTNKSVWKQYPDAMLKARAITEVARDAAPEALYGVIYTAEELGAEVEVDGDGEMIVIESATVAVEVASEDQLAQIRQLSDELGLTADQLEKGLRSITGVGDLEMLTPGDAETVITRMVERLNKKIAEETPAEVAAASDVQFDGRELDGVEKAVEAATV